MNKNIRSLPCAVSAVVSGLLMSSSAYAAFDVWDTAAPWGAATPDYFVGWNVYDNASSDASPDAPGSGAGVFNAIPSSSLYGNSNISSSTINVGPLYNVTIGGMDATSGLNYDVFVRMESYKTSPVTDATLYYSDPATQSSVGVSALSISTLIDPNTLEYESYWLFSAIPAAADYIVNVSSAGSSNGNVNVQLFDIAVLSNAATAAVPEPETYLMMALGLGLISLSRKSKK